jgi:hypothetical protein
MVSAIPGEDQSTATLTTALFHGPRCIGRYRPDGTPETEALANQRAA